MNTIRLLWCVIACVLLATADALAVSTIEYHVPMDRSLYVTPQTSIVLRSSTRLPDSAPPLEKYLHITGSLSGVHESRSVIADDRHTMIFVPDQAFLPSEHVTVRWLAGMPTATGDSVAALQFGFTIGSGVNATTASAITPHERLLKEFSSDPARALLRRSPASGGSTQRRTAVSIVPGTPPITVQWSNNPTPGGILIADIPLGSDSIAPFLLMIGNDGSIAYQRSVDGECADFKPAPNQMYSYYDLNTLSCDVIDPTISNIVQSYVCKNGYTTDLHDSQFMDNGHVLLMGNDYETVDMSGIVPGGNPAAGVSGLIIQELDRAGNLVFQWRSWDHFNITDATHEDLTQPVIDYVHGNSIQLDTDGNILLSSRHMDEVTKISRQTGDILWRWGGKHNQFRFVNDSLGFSHQHDVRRIANGDITLFDNGNYHAVQQSRACEYRLDETTMTATLVWQYSNPLGTYSASMGSVQRLDNGNTLIGWGSSSSPAVTEVTPQGVKAFEMSLPDNTISYRAYRYAMPTFAESDTPPDIPGSYVLEQNYPNPFNPSTTIEFAIPVSERVHLDVFNELGSHIKTLIDQPMPAGRYRYRFDASAFGSGVYFCRIQTPHYLMTRRMIFQK